MISERIRHLWLVRNEGPTFEWPGWLIELCRIGHPELTDDVIAAMPGPDHRITFAEVHRDLPPAA